jgi:hypothetical protein
MPTTVKQWIWGLLHAVVGGAANSVTAALVIPAQVNMTSVAGLKNMLALAGVGGCVAFWLYLKQSPIPVLTTTASSQKVQTSAGTVTNTQTETVQTGESKPQ